MSEEHGVMVEDMSEGQLQELQRDIAKEIRRREKDKAKEARKELREVAQKYGLKLEDVINSSKAATGQRAKAKAVYRHPEDPNKTWSGRGRRPRWINDWENSGKDLDELRIA